MSQTYTLLCHIRFWLQLAPTKTPNRQSQAGVPLQVKKSVIIESVVAEFQTLLKTFAIRTIRVQKQSLLIKTCPCISSCFE